MSADRAALPTERSIRCEGWMVSTCVHSKPGELNGCVTIFGKINSDEAGPQSYSIMPCSRISCRVPRRECRSWPDDVTRSSTGIWELLG